jgi:hypothetical protein
MVEPTQLDPIDRASLSPSFTPEEMALGTRWIRGRVGPRAGLDDMEKGKSLTLLGLDCATATRLLQG